MSVLSKNNINLILEIIAGSIDSNDLMRIKKDVKLFVNNRCGWYNSQRLNYKGLKDMNQRIIKETYKFATKKINQLSNPNNLSNFHSKKGNDFNLRLKNHQDNFNTLINGNKPNEIDFSDNTEDDTILDGESMEYIMNQTLNDREKELERITTQYGQDATNKASVWINGENNNPVKLNIKETVDLDNVSNLKKKQVSFDMENNNYKPSVNVDVMNEIKEFMNSQNNVAFQNIILEKLETIIKNQELIIKNMDIKKKSNPTSILKNKD